MGGSKPSAATFDWTGKDFAAIEVRTAGYTGYPVKSVNLDDLVLVRDLVFSR